MKIKEEVEIQGITNEMLLGHMVVNDLYNSAGYNCVITSGTEYAKDRLKASLHYSGNALDYRIRHLPSKEFREQLVVAIKKSLPANLYDVILEKTHIHVEYQPKK